MTAAAFFANVIPHITLLVCAAMWCELIFPLSFLRVFLVFRIYCTTWNVNGRVPPPSLDAFLQEYEVPGETASPIPDIYAIG